MCSKSAAHTMMSEACVSTQDLLPEALVPCAQAPATCGTLNSGGRCKHRHCIKKRPLADLGDDACEDAFFAEVYDLLRRLSPMRRREAIALQLSEGQRRGLEAWILATGGKSVTSSGTPRNELEIVPAKRHGKHGSRSDDVCKLRGKPGTSSVMSYSQRSSRTGRTSCWYYATVCLPGLHIIARMRREFALAAADSKVLAHAKECVMASTALGCTFDEAVRQAFAGCLGSSTPSSKFDKTQLECIPGCDGSCVVPARRRIPRAGGAQSQPESLFLRFYAAVELAGGGFRCLLRSPCCWELELALTARRRLLSALDHESRHDVAFVGQSQPNQKADNHVSKADNAIAKLRSLPHGECRAVLDRLRQEHQALHREQSEVADAEIADSVSAVVAARNFDRVERAVLEGRDASSNARLRRLLQRCSKHEKLNDCVLRMQHKRKISRPMKRQREE
eukprot:TRINITY_DN88366_c0_g1_i1.p1 TRINITY_DN88366_c0_g1~~TRINITY_DN88366_c0_g1_i1.p1  ORF type:complete len:450 (-),score=75.33 TRINITY_DN88366_c0_g1_i1:18-1367(-)